MDNHIISFGILDHRPDPAETELRIGVVPQWLTPKTEVRGRITGPRCLYSTTVEVSYPLRPVHAPLSSRPNDGRDWQPTQKNQRPSQPGRTAIV